MRLEFDDLVGLIGLSNKAGSVARLSFSVSSLLTNLPPYLVGSGGSAWAVVSMESDKQLPPGMHICKR